MSLKVDLTQRAENQRIHNTEGKQALYLLATDQGHLYDTKKIVGSKVCFFPSSILLPFISV